MRVLGRYGFVLMLGIMAAGCADLQALFAPPPPPPPAIKEPPPAATPPAKEEPAPAPAPPPQAGQEEPAKEEPAPPPPPAKEEPAPPPPPAKKEPAPPPPPAKKEPAPLPPPAKKEPAPPPPVLSPQIGREEEDRLRRDASTKIRDAEHAVQQVDQRKLQKEQQEAYTTIQSFLVTAREALSVKDFLKASNLAEKAQKLAQELIQTIR